MLDRPPGTALERGRTHSAEGQVLFGVWWFRRRKSPDARYGVSLWKTAGLGRGGGDWAAEGLDLMPP